MFLNLKANKPNGDFYYTSTSVVVDMYPHFDEKAVSEFILDTAHVYLSKGYTVVLTSETVDVDENDDGVSDAEYFAQYDYECNPN